MTKSSSENLSPGIELHKFNGPDRYTFKIKMDADIINNNYILY